MMGHQRWRAAREANRTASGLLTQIVSDDAISSTDYISRGIGDVLLPDGNAPALDIIPSSHDLDDKETLLMIAQQARFHNICDVFDHMQDRMGKIIRSWMAPTTRSSSIVRRGFRSWSGAPCAPPTSCSSPTSRIGRPRTTSAGSRSG